MTEEIIDIGPVVQEAAPKSVPMIGAGAAKDKPKETAAEKPARKVRSDKGAARPATRRRKTYDPEDDIKAALAGYHKTLEFLVSPECALSDEALSAEAHAIATAMAQYGPSEAMAKYMPMVVVSLVVLGCEVPTFMAIGRKVRDVRTNREPAEVVSLVTAGQEGSAGDGI